MTTPPVTITSESPEPWQDPHLSRDVDLSNEAPTSEPLKTKRDWTTLIMQSSANGRVYKFDYWIMQYPHADPTAPIIYEVICTNPPEILAHRDDAVCASETCFDFPRDSPVRLDLVSGLSLDLAGFSTVLDAAQKRFSLPRCIHIVLSSRLGEIDLGSFLEDIRTAGELLHWLDLPNALEIWFGDATAAGFSKGYPPVPADMDDTMVGNALTSTLTAPNRGTDCRNEGPERLPSLEAVFDPWGREWKLAKSGKGFKLAVLVSGANCT